MGHKMRKDPLIRGVGKQLPPPYAALSHLIAGGPPMRIGLPVYREASVHLTVASMLFSFCSLAHTPAWDETGICFRTKAQESSGTAVGPQAGKSRSYLPIHLHTMSTKRHQALEFTGNQSQ